MATFNFRDRAGGESSKRGAQLAAMAQAVRERRAGIGLYVTQDEDVRGIRDQLIARLPEVALLSERAEAGQVVLEFSNGATVTLVRPEAQQAAVDFEPPFQMKEVRYSDREPSNVVAYGYHRDLSALTVVFKRGSGAVVPRARAGYHFLACPPSVYQGLDEAESKGSHFARVIKPLFEPTFVVKATGQNLGEIVDVLGGLYAAVLMPVVIAPAFARRAAVLIADLRLEQYEMLR